MTQNREPNRRLFIGGLPYRYTEGELLSLFITEGKIIAVRIIHNKWGKSRGMGYVEYENESDAIRAKSKFHNYNMGEGRHIIVDYAEPDPFLTEEGRLRHEEAIERKGIKKKHTFEKRENKETKESDQSKPKLRFTSKERVRKSLFESRNFGSRIGKKFSSKTKKKQQKKYD